jgi:hypothetical protein
MNIYLVERTDRYSYDEYDSFIVVAKNEECATDIDPSGEKFSENDRCSSWVNNKNNLKVTLLGRAAAKIATGVVLASFNAG